MPVFEFRCVQCGHLFEKLFRTNDEKVDLTCPQCGADSLERVMSRANHVMGLGKAGKMKPTVTTKSCRPGSSCTTIDIPGPSR